MVVGPKEEEYQRGIAIRRIFKDYDENKKH
jgi:hypothetical protein